MTLKLPPKYEYENDADSFLCEKCQTYFNNELFKTNQIEVFLILVHVVKQVPIYFLLPL